MSLVDVVLHFRDPGGVTVQFHAAIVALARRLTFYPFALASSLLRSAAVEMSGNSLPVGGSDELAASSAFGSASPAPFELRMAVDVGVCARITSVVAMLFLVWEDCLACAHSLSHLGLVCVVSLFLSFSFAIRRRMRSSGSGTPSRRSFRGSSSMLRARLARRNASISSSCFFPSWSPSATRVAALLSWAAALLS